MKQADYWKNRFTQLEDAQNSKALDYYSTLEDEFSRAARNADKELATWYTRFAKNENISYEEAKQVLSKGELSAFKMSVENYTKKGKTLPYSDQWAKELERASAKFHVTRLESLQLQMQQQIEVMYGYELDTFDRFISNQYKAGYYKTMFEFQKGFGVGFDVMKLDDNKIAKLIAKPWAPDGQNFSSRIWRDKNKLMAEMPSILTQATIRGDGYDKTAKLLAERFNVSKSQAKNLVITESAFFSSASQTDCFNNLGVMDYEIIATLDGKTSEICRMMDGKVFDMKDRKSGITCPPFHGRCRSTSAPYFNDEFELNTKRAARDPDTGKTYHVPANLKYPDWEKSFVNGARKDGLEALNGGIINKAAPFQKATIIEDTEEYARNELGIKTVSYKGVDIETANAWNQGLSESFEKFPELKNNFGFVGEARERNKALKPIYRQHILDQLVKNNPNHTLPQLEPYAEKEIKRFMRKMQVSKNTYAQSWSPQIAPLSDFKGVVVNGDWGKKSDLFIKALENDVSTKYHPVGCATIRSVLDHEIGHQLDDLLGISGLPDVQKIYNSRSHTEITEALSKYSWNNKNKNRYSEMVAEAWAEYCNNPDPREIAKTIGEIIEDAYKNKFGNP
jgi:phage putative head morphogenesis protein, SPP1 gp7 family